jgi:hypothetical protein
VFESKGGGIQYPGVSDRLRLGSSEFAQQDKDYCIIRSKKWGR